jgi:hypothetical protein
VVKFLLCLYWTRLEMDVLWNHVMTETHDACSILWPCSNGFFSWLPAGHIRVLSLWDSSLGAFPVRKVFLHRCPQPSSCRHQVQRKVAKWLSESESLRAA